MSTSTRQRKAERSRQRRADKLARESALLRGRLDRLPDGRSALHGFSRISVTLVVTGLMLMGIYVPVTLVELRNDRLAQNLQGRGLTAQATLVEQDVTRGKRTYYRANMRAALLLPQGPVVVRLEGYDNTLPDVGRRDRGWEPVRNGSYKPPLKVIYDTDNPRIGMAYEDYQEQLRGGLLRDGLYFGGPAATLLVLGIVAHAVRLVRRRLRHLAAVEYPP